MGEQGYYAEGAWERPKGNMVKKTKRAVEGVVAEEESPPGKKAMKSDDGHETVNRRYIKAESEEKDAEEF